MGSLSLRARYQRHSVDEGVEYIEANFERGFVDWEMDPGEAGFVLVDCWDRHPIASHQKRAEEICNTRLVPAAEACREAGVAIIHAPSPPQARLYPQWTKFAGDRELFGADEEPPAWPPEQFRDKEGDYAQFARPREPRHDAWVEAERDNRRIIACLEPRPEDFVIATGEQLHRLCRHEGIVHLFYCGFAANMCVPGRDYGMRAMQRRGYTIVLLRDGTTAIEAGHTVDDLALTEASILEVEMLLGFTVTSAELIAACGAAAS
ncbi:MAG: isochorismatase family protein [Armatimonadota bacterium]